MGKSFDITFYWNLSSKVISLSNCSKARRLRMFVISFFANLFCRMFNPFNSLATYFPNTSSSLSSFSSFINVSVNFRSISVFEEGASVIFCRLFEALLFFTHFSYPVASEITDEGFLATTFPIQAHVMLGKSSCVQLVHLLPYRSRYFEDYTCCFFRTQNCPTKWEKDTPACPFLLSLSFLPRFQTFLSLPRSSFVSHISFEDSWKNSLQLRLYLCQNSLLLLPQHFSFDFII